LVELLFLALHHEHGFVFYALLDETFEVGAVAAGADGVQAAFYALQVYLKKGVLLQEF
jgi:hypothetical protein